MAPAVWQHGGCQSQEDTSPMEDACLMEDDGPTEDARGRLALWPPKQGNHAAMPQ